MKTRAMLLLIPLLLVGCTDTDPKQLKDRLIGGAKEERVIPVGILNIDTLCGVIRNTYPGYVEEGQSVSLAFKYAGTVESIRVKEGSKVAKGQELARVSSPSLENSKRSAKATLDQAQDAYDRLKKVYENGSLPEIKWKEMESNLEKAQAAVDLANAMVDENILRAPFSGTITDIRLGLGENVSPLTPAMRLIGGSSWVVKISVPEDEISKIQMHDKAEIIIPALGDRSFTGEVIEKSMTASMMTHSYPAKVLIEQPSPDLSLGMIGKVILKSDVKKGIVIPANAVLLNQEGRFVWIEEEGRATRRKVIINGYSGNGVVISEGLQGGEHVIVEGYQKISEGMKVSY